MYEAYIFDLYGTLVDIRTNEEKPYLWKKMSEIYSSMGAYYEPMELKREMRFLEKAQKESSCDNIEGAFKDNPVEPDLTKVFEKLYEQKGCAVDSEVVRITAITFRTLSRQRLEVYEGVKETLTRLHNNGKKIYLLSNAQRDFTRPELDILGLTPYFDGIMISSEEGCKKPSALFYNKLLQRYNLDVHKCLMVGNDEMSDIEGALRIGMDSLYIHTDISPQLEAKSRATYCVMDGGFKKAAQMYL